MAKLFRTLWGKIVNTFSFEESDTEPEVEMGPGGLPQRIYDKYAEDYDAEEKGMSFNFTSTQE